MIRGQHSEDEELTMKNLRIAAACLALVCAVGLTDAVAKKNSLLDRM